MTVNDASDWDWCHVHDEAPRLVVLKLAGCHSTFDLFIRGFRLRISVSGVDP